MINSRVRRAKIAAHETHSKHRREFIHQLLELLGIERDRVLFLPQVRGGQPSGLLALLTVASNSSKIRPLDIQPQENQQSKMKASYVCDNRFGGRGSSL